jgi:hypothetical protein
MIIPEKISTISTNYAEDLFKPAIEKPISPHNGNGEEWFLAGP